MRTPVEELHASKDNRLLVPEMNGSQRMGGVEARECVAIICCLLRCDGDLVQ